MQNKINYDAVMLETIKNLKDKPKLLLHSCCAPCSSSVLEKLAEHFEVTVFYYNPNIYPEEEYEIRKNEQKRFLKEKQIPFIEGDYIPKNYYSAIKGLENEQEGGKRCYKCYEMRMEKTAKKAKDEGFEYFCTTLSVSPHKNSEYVNKIGKELSEKYNIKFLFSDFKKRNGFLRSTQISKEYNFYRQKYCGCIFSINK